MTELLSWIVLGFSCARLAVALVNYFSRERTGGGNPSAEPHVSVIIPARNEEDNIGQLLGDLVSQDYRNIGIIVVNDQSDDNTAAIARSYSAIDNRVVVIDTGTLPYGWTGKNRACKYGSDCATGQYFLFIDADVRAGKKLIGETVEFMRRNELSLLSIFPEQLMLSPGEKATVPVMNYILLSLLPLPLVRLAQNSSLAAANGQFMLFTSAVYRKLRPHETMKDNLVEDIAIARYLKKQNFKVACLADDGLISCRMYRNWSEAASGFSKNVFAFFGGSASMAVLYWLLTTFGFISVLLSSSLTVFIAYLMICLLTRVLISKISRQNILDNILYIVPQQAAMGLFIYRAFKIRLTGRYRWKGRTV